MIRWVRDDPEHLALETEAPGRVFLVVADSDFPGWHAFVGGKPVPIVPANLLVRGVVLPPGRHVVEMRYECAGVREGVAVTRAGLAAWCLLALGFGVAAARSARRAWRGRSGTAGRARREPRPLLPPGSIPARPRGGG